MRIEWTDDLVIKAAESGDERHRLAREASVLRAVAHPAIVRLTGSDVDEASSGVTRLYLQRVHGTTLASAPHQPEEVVAGWGAAVATVVGDLHDLGYAHRAISPEHVLIDEHGRPILCGFGQAAELREIDDDAVESDVRAVAVLVFERLPSGHDRLSRLLRRWADGRHRHRGDARALARMLVEHVPNATVRPVPVAGATQDASEPVGSEREPAPVGSEREPAPVGSEREPAPVGSEREPAPVGSEREPAPVGSEREPALGGGARSARGGTVAADGSAPPGVPGPVRRRAVGLAWAAGMTVGAAVGVGGFIVLGQLSPGGSSGQPSPYLMRSAPGEHPITVVGRWGCGPARPAVLDAGSGTVWTFPVWPSPDGMVTGSFLQRVVGASGLAAVSDGPRCDRLVVLRHGHPDMPLAVGPRD